MQKQSGAIVFREAYEGYIPLGVWACREITRQALRQQAKTFNTMQDALNYINPKLKLGVERFKRESTLLKSVQVQRNLFAFM